MNEIPVSRCGVHSNKHRKNLEIDENLEFFSFFLVLLPLKGVFKHIMHPKTLWSYQKFLSGNCLIEWWWFWFGLFAHIQRQKNGLLGKLRNDFILVSQCKVELKWLWTLLVKLSYKMRGGGGVKFPTRRSVYPTKFCR